MLTNLLLLTLPNFLLASLQIQPDNVFSMGRHSYRTLLVSPKSNSLYVGAQGHLFRLWLYNINDTSSTSLFAHRVLEVPAEERDECLRLGNSDRECDASIRMLFPKQNGHLMVCLSHAMKPQLGTIDGQNLSDVDEPAKTVIGICSQHDHLNTTAVFVETGNPEEIPSVYSGIRTGLSLENHLIYRPPLVKNGREVHPALRTSIYDSTWLNEPQFVASFSINQYVYFFFREQVPDFQGHGRTVVSRVARICKSDLGGRQVLRQVWTSFIKARLNCSISATQPPFYFDHIQSIVKVERDHEQDSASADFYGTFTTAESPFQASAICVFNLNVINRLFDTGLFLEQSAAGNSWMPTPPDQVPGNRPGTCLSDSRTLSDEELHFAKSHMLMADPVPSLQQPLIYRRNEPLTSVVADRRDAQTVVLFALSPTRNSLLKVVHWGNENERSGSRESNVLNRNARLLAVYHLPVKEPVNSIALLPNEYLFVGQDSQVSQFRLSQCHLQKGCERCALDPYCSWNIARAECFAQETVHTTAVGWITADAGSNSKAVSEKCRSYTRTISMTLFPGDSIFLECPGAADEADSETEEIQGGSVVNWSVDGVKLMGRNVLQNYRQTLEGGIVLLNVTRAQSGDYRCSIDGSPIVEYAVRVDDEDCARPRTVQQFHSAQREWCRKLGDYKNNLHKWQNLYEVSKDQTDCANTKTATEGTADGDGESSKNAFF